jgi:hypothetical protein
MSNACTPAGLEEFQYIVGLMAILRLLAAVQAAVQATLGCFPGTSRLCCPRPRGTGRTEASVRCTIVISFAYARLLRCQNTPAFGFSTILCPSAPVARSVAALRRSLPPLSDYSFVNCLFCLAPAGGASQATLGHSARAPREPDSGIRWVSRLSCVLVQVPLAC